MLSSTQELTGRQLKIQRWSTMKRAMRKKEYHRSSPPPSQCLGERSRDLYTESGQILQCSFSSISAPPIARVVSFFSIFRNLQDFHPFALLRSQNFSKNLLDFFPHFYNFFAKFWLKFAQFQRNFTRISPEFHRICANARQGRGLGSFPNFPRIFPDLQQFGRKAQVSSMR